MDELIELLLIQIIYIAILFFIIRSVIRRGSKAIFYWIIVALYVATIAWLMTDYFNMPKTGNGGYFFAIGMYSMIIPGILILISVIVFALSRVSKKNVDNVT